MTGEDFFRLGKYRMILVVEDNPDTRGLLCRQLIRAGYDVAECEDGEKAIEALKKQDFQALLLDVSMPQMDGFDVLEWMSVSERRIPTVIITGGTHGMSPAFLESYGAALNAHSVLAKPFSEQQLMEVLQDVLSA